MSAAQDLQFDDTDLIRSSPGCAYGSVLFILDCCNNMSSAFLDKARDALLGHNFIFEVSGSRIATSIDTVRYKSNQDRRLAFEAHLKGIDSHSSLQPFLRYILKKHGNDYRIPLTFEGRSQPVYAKMMSTIPPRPIYNCYHLADMPLGNPNQIKVHLESAIRDALPNFLRETPRSYSPLTINNKGHTTTLVESFPDYKGGPDSDRADPMYLCSFIVIIDTTQGELNSAIRFRLAGQEYVLDNTRGMKYYLYCTKCKILDSHETGDFDCPYYGSFFA